MKGEGQRKPAWRGGGTVALALMLLAAALFVIGRDFHVRAANTRAHQLLAIDTALGATLEPLDATTARALGNGNNPLDMVVTSVASGGPADHAGIHVGDVIEEINGSPPGSTAEVAAALGPSVAVILVNRRGKRVRIRLQLGSPQPKG